jgi:hypothetical protein
VRGSLKERQPPYPHLLSGKRAPQRSTRLPPAWRPQATPPPKIYYAQHVDSIALAAAHPRHSMLTGYSRYERLHRVHEFSSAAADLTSTLLSVNAAGVVGLVKVNDELGVALA